jgi:hypothetical protein
MHHREGDRLRVFTRRAALLGALDALAQGIGLFFERLQSGIVSGQRGRNVEGHH